MSEKHFSWDDWEAGEPIDERHLEVCPECRREVRLLRFVQFQTESAPRLEASPFFASRVARLAAAEIGAPFWIVLATAARRLVPVFALFLLATSFLLYRSVQVPSVGDGYLEVLVEPSDAAVPTLDDMVVFLREPEGEDGEN